MLAGDSNKNEIRSHFYETSAVYIDEMQWAGGGGKHNISSLNGDQMTRLELPSTGMCKE